MPFLIIYVILGYWATGKTIYANYVMIGTYHNIFMRRFLTGAALGWILIPIAIIKTIAGKSNK